MPSVGKDGRKTALARRTAAKKNIPIHCVTSITVVKINCSGAMPHLAAYVAPKVKTDNVAPAGRIAAFVERPGVITRSADIMHEVELKNIVIAIDANGHVRRI